MGFLSGITDFVGDVFDKGKSFILPAVGTALGGPVGGLLGTLGSSALDIATDVGSQWVSNEVIDKPNSAFTYAQSKEAADLAWARSKSAASKQFAREYGAYRSRFQNTTRDLRKAGLNPILAATGGFNVGNGPNASMANVPQASGASVTQPNSGSSALNFSKAEESKSSSKLKTAQIGTEFAKAAELRARKGLISQQEKESVQRVINMEQEFRKMAYEISLLSEKQMLTSQETQNLKSLNKRLKILNNRLKAELNKITTISNVYKGPAGQFLSWVSEILGSIGSILKGGYKSTTIYQGGMN